ncbi:MAG: choice-of-anchor L domain-containing protein, partial [Chloroflexota bacterium]
MKDWHLNQHFRRKTDKKLPAFAIAILLFTLLNVSLSSAQTGGLVTEDLNAHTAQELVDTLKGSGVTINSVTYTGDQIAAGKFSGGTGIIGFEDGIILSTGNISSVIGPNDEAEAGTDLDSAGDSDLDLLTGQGANSTEDAAILEIEFVPDGSDVFFNFVFASDEYLEFVEQDFNDAFGFFINQTNCAIVNGEPISIKNINNNKNSDFYRNNPQDTQPINTQMDGLTTVITCNASVNAGVANTLKLAIADAGDGSVDSNVFIEAGTFSTEAPPPPITELPNLIAHYKLDGNADDSSGNNQHAQSFGAVATTDRFGNTGGAYYFDGDDYIQTPIDGSTFPVSYSFWFKADDVLDGSQSIVDSDSSGRYGHSIILNYRDVNGELDVQYHNGPFVGTGNGNTGFFPESEAWHHVVANFDTDTVTVYANGEKVHEFSNSPTVIDGENFRIGRHNQFDTRFFKGAVDDVRFYSEPLTDAEVSAIYNNGVEPPAVTAGGTVQYTAEDEPIVISPDLTLSAPGGSELESANVSINDGFVPAEDRLGIQGQEGQSGTIVGLDWSYNQDSGVLELSGPAPLATYESALRKVTYSNTSGTPTTADRSISASIGANLYYDGNGHYYEYVEAPNMTWTDAKAAAEGKDFYGLQGYLATVISAGENGFVATKLEGNGWIGATDDPAYTPEPDNGIDKKWYWATGPEADTHFFTQAADLNGCGKGPSATQPIDPETGQPYYQNWDTAADTEPNDASFNGGTCPNKEDYAHYFERHPYNANANNHWNDFPNDPLAVWGNAFSIDGYLVEYGGMPGDPSLSITGEVKVEVQKRTETQQACTQQALVDLLNGTGATIELDGSCNYILDGAPTNNGYNIELWSKTNKVINGNGATISQGTTSATKEMIFMGNGSNITINDVTFTSANHGVLRMQTVTGLTLDGVTFTNNTGTSLLLFSNSTGAKLTGVVFEGNQSSSSTAGIQIAGGTLEISDSTFKDNSGSAGGALAASNNAAVTISYVTFDGNKATEKGGAISFTGSGSLEVTNAKFLKNSGKRGGAIYGAAPMTVRNSVFADNLASHSGAAIHSDNSATIQNNTIVAAEQNTKSAIFVWGQMNVANNIIADHATGLEMGKVNGSVQ